MTSAELLFQLSNEPGVVLLEVAKLWHRDVDHYAFLRAELEFLQIGYALPISPTYLGSNEIQFVELALHLARSREVGKSAGDLLFQLIGRLPVGFDKLREC